MFGRVGLENITTSTTTLHPPPPTHREYTDGTTTSCCCCCLLILAALDIFRTEQVLIWSVWERCGSVGQMGQRADLEYHNNNAGLGQRGPGVGRCLLLTQNSVENTLIGIMMAWCCGSQLDNRENKDQCAADLINKDETQPPPPSSRLVVVVVVVVVQISLGNYRA